MSIDGGLWQELRPRLRELRWDMQRIETGIIGAGVPDVNICKQGCDVWLELKWTPGWKPRIRPEQIGWAERRIRHGGRVLMLTWRRCEAGERREAASELWIHYGDDMRHVLDGGLRATSPVLLCRGGPAAWDWTSIDGALLGLLS